MAWSSSSPLTVILSPSSSSSISSGKKHNSGKLEWIKFNILEYTAALNLRLSRKQTQTLTIVIIFPSMKAQVYTDWWM